MIKISLFGGFQVSKKSRKVNKIGSIKATELLKYFCLNKNKKLNILDIYEIFWEDFDEDSARKNLNSTLYYIRKNLGITKESLYLNHHHCCFCPEDVEIDIETFEEKVNQAEKSSSLEEKLDILLEAEKIYKGKLLPENDFDNWTENQREYFVKTYVNVLSKISDIYESFEDNEKAYFYLEKAFNYDKNRDDIWLKLISLHIKNNKYIEAKKLYQEYEKMFDLIDQGFMKSSLKEIYQETENKLKSNDQKGASYLPLEEFNLVKNVITNKRNKDFIYCEIEITDEKNIHKSMKCVKEKIRKNDIITIQNNTLKILFREIKDLSESKDLIEDKLKEILKKCNQENYKINK